MSRAEFRRRRARNWHYKNSSATYEYAVNVSSRDITAGTNNVKQSRGRCRIEGNDDVTGIQLSRAELRRREQQHFSRTSANTSSRDDEIDANHNQNLRGGCGVKTSAVSAPGDCASLNAVSTALQDKDQQILIQIKIRLSKAQAEYSKVSERLRILDALDKEQTLLESRRHA